MTVIVISAFLSTLQEGKSESGVATSQGHLIMISYIYIDSCIELHNNRMAWVGKHLKVPTPSVDRVTTKY